MKITSGKTPKSRRALLYGTHGIGKSTFANGMPDTIFIQPEDGLNDIDVNAKFPVANTYEDVMSQVKYLCKEEHGYQTVAVDSLDWLERLIQDHVCKENDVDNIAKIGYGKGYDFVLSMWRDFLAGMEYLQNQKGMHIFFIAHSETKKIDDPEVESFHQYAPKLHKRVSELIQEWCYEVFFVRYQVATKIVEGDFGRKTVKGVGTGQRVMLTQERPAYKAKNHLNMDLEVPFEPASYTKFLTPQKGK